MDHKETAATSTPLMASAPITSASVISAKKPWAGKRLHLWTTACDPSAPEVTEVLSRGRGSIGIACTSVTREGGLRTQDERPFGRGRGLVAQKVPRASLVIANPGTGGFDGALGMQVVSDDKARARLVDELERVVKKEGYKAVELDLEAMPTAAAPYFVALATEAVKRLSGIEIVVDVHPKTADDPGWDGPGAHDYAALANAGAVVRLMTYDLSIGPVPPGPCTTAKWIREVVAYAKSKGVPADKLEIGLPAYGYDFPAKGPAVPLRYTEVMALGARVKAAVERDENGTPHFKYADHQVWFDDAVSIERLLRDLGDVAGDVRGIAIWGIGRADPKLGKVLADAGL